MKKTFTYSKANFQKDNIYAENIKKQMTYIV